MSGGGSGGGTGINVTKQLFDPAEQAARNRVFQQAGVSFDAQQSAIQGTGTPGTPAVAAQPAIAAQAAVPGSYQNTGANIRGIPTRSFVPGTPAVAGQAAVPAQAAIPGTGGNANTPGGNFNPAAEPIPFDPLTLQSQQLLQEFALGRGQAGVNASQAALDYGLNVAPDPNNNPALQDLLGTVNRRLSQQFTDPGGPLSQIRDQQLQAGQYGGTRQGIGEGIATARFGEILGDTTAQIVNNAYNTGQDTFVKSLALAPQTLGLGALPATQVGAIGAQNENQAAIQEQYNASGRFFDLNSPFAALQNYANIVNGTISPGQISTGTPGAGGGGSSGIGGILSGGLGGAGIGGSIAAGTAVGGPWGAAIGAGVGILGSIFS